MVLCHSNYAIGQPLCHYRPDLSNLGPYVIL